MQDLRNGRNDANHLSALYTQPTVLWLLWLTTSPSLFTVVPLLVEPMTSIIPKNISLCIRICIHTDVCIYICVCVRVCNIYICVYIYTYIYMCVYIYVYIYVHYVILCRGTSHDKQNITLHDMHTHIYTYVCI